VTALDMQPLQARFATQDQAESAMRKLASLRSDRFRLERVGHEAQTNTSELESTFTSNVEELSSSGFTSSAAEFTLSANVPSEATEQARRVVLQAGGQLS